MYSCSAYCTAAPARRAVHLKCTSDFQPAALRLVAEVNRNENTPIWKTFPTHMSSKGISFASQLRTSRGRPNKDLLKFRPPRTSAVCHVCQDPYGVRDSSPPWHAKCCLWWRSHPSSFSLATSKLGGRTGLANGQTLLIASRNCSLSIDSLNGACECFGEQRARGTAQQKEISSNFTGSGCPQPCSAQSCCRGCRGRGFLGCLGGRHPSGLYLEHLWL